MKGKNATLLIEAVTILRECERTWGCECPYCDRDYGAGFDEHATESNGAGFACRLWALLAATDMGHAIRQQVQEVMRQTGAEGSGR